MVEKDLMAQWQEQAVDYPTKSLLVALKEMNRVQQERLQILYGQMDGQMWSPHDWDEEM